MYSTLTLSQRQGIVGKAKAEKVYLPLGHHIEAWITIKIQQLKMQGTFMSMNPSTGLIKMLRIQDING